MIQKSQSTSTYQTAVRALLQLHQLDVAGKLDSPGADALRDAMDEPWKELSEIERQRLRGLSEDLNSIMPDGPHKPSGPTDPSLDEVNGAMEQEDWDHALELLRRYERDLPPTQASFLRGTIWRSAGAPEIASLFFEHAHQAELP